MLKRSEVVRLARGATRRVMAKKAGIFAAKAHELRRLDHLKKVRGSAKNSVASARRRHLVGA